MILEYFNNFWAGAVDIAWGLPLVFILVGAGIYFTIACRFLPFRGLKHAFDILRGKYDKEDDPGEISELPHKKSNRKV